MSKRIFAIPIQVLISAVLSFGGQASGPQDVVRIGPGVKPPKPIHRPEPTYSSEARNAHIQGTVLLETIIDEHGKPTNISVISPLGFGLDEQAQSTIEKWRFEAGTKDGKPVKILATIEVNFRFQRIAFDSKAEQRRTQYNLAMALLNDEDSKHNERGRKIMQDLANQKYPPAMYVLSQLISNGELGSPDPDRATALMTKAADKNFGPAMYHVGLMYCEGRQVPRDTEKGMKLIRDAAILGATQAQFYLGARYETGEGVPRDAERARRYFRLCAKPLRRRQGRLASMPF